MHDNDISTSGADSGSPLVVLNGSEAVASSLTIAAGTEVEHRAVLQLVRGSLVDFEQFGGVAFEMRPFETAGGIQTREVALLTEPQATLLLTFMRNTEVVKRFKVALVRAFFELRERVVQRPALPTTRELAQMVLDAEDARDVAERQLELESKARRAMESYAKDLEPRAEGYDRLMDGDGTYAVGAVAKMIGTSQNKLWADLRAADVMIAKGAMRNTPYQRYMHHFDVKAYEYTREDGSHGNSYRTRVRPSGIDFICRKLGRSVAVDA